MADELTPEQREETRQTQLNILNSDSLKNFVYANAGRDVTNYGEVGKQATHDISYVRAMTHPDGYTGQLMANAFLGAEAQSREAYGGAVTPVQLLQTAETFYLSGIDNVKVSDIIEKIGTEVSTDVLSEEQREMYMGDLKEVNQEAYQTIAGVFVQGMKRIGVGEAISQSGRQLSGGLERMLTPRESRE